MNGLKDDGIVNLCTLTDISAPGEMAHEVLTRVARHWFEQRIISFRRQYAAKGVNEQIDMVIRIHNEPRARIGMYAVLGNGDQYRIDGVTPISNDETWQRDTELTLSRLEKFYDLAES